MNKILLILIVLAFTPSCVSAPAVLPPVGQSSSQSVTSSWWQARYKLKWNEEDSPRWWLDGLLANEVFAKAMSAAGVEPELWRFHRRAKADASGYQFSFLFYASAQQAAKLQQQIVYNSVAKSLSRRGIIQKLLLDPAQNLSATSIAKTSDAGWDPKLQEAWPYFAMGVSKSWLSLTRACLPPAKDSSLDSLLEAYEKASDCVTAIWRKQGQHAFLHHLQALMGYEPLPIGTEVRF